MLLNVVDVSELVAARRQAEEASHAKSRFLAGMSHEIRTPMTAILGYADLLADPSLPASDHDNYVAVIRRNGEHLLGLINDVLDIARIEAGKLRMVVGPCSLVSVIADVVSMMRVRADLQGTVLDVRYDGPLPQTIHSDAGRLRQALVNLVGNAVKFTERGSVHIVVRFLPAWREGQAAVQIDVADTGIGIREEHLPHLFEAFVQADDSTSGRHGGTGLGLTVTRYIVRTLGGDIRAESVYGQGSTFSIIVPAGDPDGVPMLQHPAEAAHEAERRFCRETDLPARYGGEEFAILALGETAEGAACLAERCRAAIAAHPLARDDGGGLNVTASFGVAESGEVATAAELVERADRRLYAAKAAGRNTVDSRTSAATA